MGVTITDTDHGYRSLLARVFELAKRSPVITIGVHEAEGAAQHLEGQRAMLGVRKSGNVAELPTVLDIATWNEFGTTRIPERSFIRAWFDEAEEGLRKDLVLLAQSVVAGKRTADQVLELLGLRSVGQIQARIAQGIAPENAQSTIDAKGGSTTPLINTGVLRSSISYKVEGK